MRIIRVFTNKLNMILTQYQEWFKKYAKIFHIVILTFSIISRLGTSKNHH